MWGGFGHCYCINIFRLLWLCSRQIQMSNGISIQYQHIFLNIIHSFVFRSCFILLRVMLSPLIQVMLGVRQEYMLDGMPAHTHSHLRPICISTQQHVLGRKHGTGEPRGNLHGHEDKMHRNSIQTVTRAQDQTGAPGAARRQCYLLHQHASH